MKRILLCALALVVLLTASLSAYAATAPIADAPYLEDITFSNAAVDGGFAQGKTDFTVTLDNPAQSAVVSGYKISGEASVFIEYLYTSNQQDGVSVTLNFANGSVIYRFMYSNISELAVNGNANLASITCEYGELQPELNERDTVYKLYIPSDLTVLNITPVTADVGAVCTPITGLELREDQTPQIPLTVIASDGTTKKYTLKIKRVDKTVEQIKAEMQQENYTSFVAGEMFYEKPNFLISLCAVIGGLVVFAVAFSSIRKAVVNPYDSEEPEFYAAPEPEEEREAEE